MTAEIRLKKIMLCDFKNVKNGTITMPNTACGDPFAEGAEVLGIYGQNGSGKTSVIDALSFLKNMISGKPLRNNAGDYVLASEEKCRLCFDFLLQNGEEPREIGFSFEITRDGATGEESLHKLCNGRKSVFASFDPQTDEILPKKTYRAFSAEDKIALRVADVVSKKENTSFLFCPEAFDTLQKGSSELKEALSALRAFSEKLFVVDDHAVASGLSLPHSFVTETLDGVSGKGRPIPLDAPFLVLEEEFDRFSGVIDITNGVLGAIVPKLSLKLVDYGAQLLKDGRHGRRTELVSVRDGLQIPLKYESEGIRKIISILNVMIAMYADSGVCVAIDELDAGVYEYLLGEILSVLQESGKGQLIFTSHNLRPLEMISPDAIIFTTVNPKNRYIRFSRAGESNFRDLYLRSINLGGQKEEVYETTDSFEMSRAFRKAGRQLSHER